MSDCIRSPAQPLVIADCYECGHCVDLHAPNATADAPSLVAARAQIAAFVAQLFDGAIRATKPGLFFLPGLHSTQCF